MDFNLFDHACALLILVLLPLLSIRSGKITEDKAAELPPKIHFFYTNGLLLIIAAMLVLTSWNVSPRSWASMGFDWPIASTTVTYLTLALVAVYLIDVFWEIYTSKDNSDETMDSMSNIVPITWREFSHFTFLAVSAGITEEIIFRGFLTTYLFHYASISGMNETLVIATATLIPAISFAFSHAYQGTMSVMKIFAIAILFGLIFIFSQSLLIVVIVHVAIDLVSGLMTVMINKEDEAL